ncbi:stage II sporulation protein P [Pontibacillus halophilus JSM 076056 = DSM 19796]|uniref:Stage II sporulation protein P n=1 Tax=Pontibacillus halophilus JSM 076056 = DSM 19796 TaxID=1385510 RepID=A0A0A5GJY3_9BACI|nr:stage II sporulation protein P [Pontibacillus halophilus]KGX93566.1 stage II sporulation protein P [Pontibacillus halophilus JSM 076056 = DSM 19796]
MYTRSNSSIKESLRKWYKRSSVYVGAVCLLFLLIGILTSIQPAYRLSSSAVHDWTSQVKGSSFLYLMGMENRMFESAFPEDQEEIKVSKLMFQLATSVKPDDPRSLLGREIPGFASYDGEIIVAGEGMDYTSMPIESNPPMEIFDQEKEAIVTETPEEKEPASPKDEAAPTTGDRDVVYIYHTHNRESYFPLLPEGTKDAFHSEANITMVGERLAQQLEANGIGTTIDKTDFTKLLKDKGMEYHQSYDASRPVVEAAMNQDENLNFFFDLHRDALPKEKTTTTIEDKSYARILFVVGGEYAKYEENLKLANELHKMIEEDYPGLSKGVITKKGAGVDGKYNQDLAQNSALIEFGGVDNNLDELYRTADAIAEVFSDYYWDAEKVDGTR